MIPLINTQLGCVTEGKVPDHDGSPVESPIGNIQITVLFFLFFCQKIKLCPTFQIFGLRRCVFFFLSSSLADVLFWLLGFRIDKCGSICICLHGLGHLLLYNKNFIPTT